MGKETVVEIRVLYFIYKLKRKTKGFQIGGTKRKVCPHMAEPKLQLQEWTLARSSLAIAACGRVWRLLREAKLILEKGIRICHAKDVNQSRLRLM